MELVTFDWNLSAGSILIILSIIGSAYAVYRASPIGQDTVEALRTLLDVTEKKLHNAETDAAERFSQVEHLKTELNSVKVDLARCEEQPKTEELARAITVMQEGFSNHRDDLLHTQNRILAHLETTTEAIKSMEQAMTLVAERLHADSQHRRSKEAG